MFDQRQTGHQAATAQVPDQRVIGERREGFLQIRRGVIFDPLDQLLFFHPLDIGQRHRTSHRVAAVGIAVVELAAFLYQHIGHAIADHDAAQRLITAGHAFGKSDQVWLVAELFVSEPGA